MMNNKYPYTIINKSIFLVLYFMNSIILFSQELPNEFFEYKLNRIGYESSKINWGNNTTFGPIRFQDINKNLNIIKSVYTDDSLALSRLAGINIDFNNYNLYGFQHISYKSKLYTYLYIRLVSDSEYYSRYTGVSRKTDRLGFSSGETDIAGIGYQDQRFLLQFGRGRQSWGVGNDVRIGLNEDSPSYDYGLCGLNFGKYKFRYFHGFLENIDFNNRYITGRGLEWNNQKDLLISFSEIVIYSGPNRPLDFSYLNPVSTHLEIELNDRQNKLGVSSGNAIWQLSIDHKIKSDIRIMTNIIIDEFVLDKIQLDSNKTNGMAYSGKIIWSPLLNSNISNIFISVINVGTKTFRHEVGYNNFIQRKLPLGWAHGSDGYELNTGINFIVNNKMLGQAILGKRKIGDASLLNLPYKPNEDYLKDKFPSGKVNAISFFKSRIDWKIKNNLYIFASIDYSMSSIDDEELKFNIGIDLSNS